MNTYPKYVWAVVPQNKKEFNGCLDIRRYAFSHRYAVNQLKHCQSRKHLWGYKDCSSKGVWVLFKLVRVNKRRLYVGDNRFRIRFLFYKFSI